MCIVQGTGFQGLLPSLSRTLPQNPFIQIPLLDISPSVFLCSAKLYFFCLLKDISLKHDLVRGAVWSEEKVVV